jgi:tetratricopeptide (TPR) repeat protein
MYDFPQDPKKISPRIRRYERALRCEQECYGFINDGAGKRYLLGALYLLMGDTAGAVRSFAWFAQTFPDDSGDPLQYLCWTLALYRAGELEHATVKLRQTMLSNLYLVPRLLGLEQDHIDLWYPSNLAEQRYSDEVPEEVLMLWEPSALQWAHTLYQSASMQGVQRRSIAIYHQLKTERPGPKRSRLVAEAYRLQYRTLHSILRTFFE